MNYLFFGALGDKGGSEVAMLNLIKSIKSEENDAKITVIIPYKGNIYEEYIKAEVDVVIRRFPRNVTGFFTKKNKIHRILSKIEGVVKETYNVFIVLGLLIYFTYKKKSFDIIINNTGVINIGILYGAISGNKAFLFLQEFIEIDHGLTYNFGWKRQMKLYNTFSKQIIVNSQIMYDYFKNNFDKDKLHILYYQNIKLFDEKIKETDNGANIKLCITGVVTKTKGQHIAIQALKHLYDQGEKNILLDIIGPINTDYKEYLDTLITPQIKDKITFFGYQQNPLDYMKKCDIYLMCSRCEAFGMVTIEAMSCQKPIIGSNSGANKELIGDNKGCLFESENYIDLAKKILFLIQNKHLIKEFGKNAKEFSEFFGNKKQYYEKFTKIINKK